MTTTFKIKDEVNSLLFFNENLEKNSSLEKLLKEKQEGQNTDVVLIVHGKSFKCHSSVLAATSPYFESKLKISKNKNKDEIMIGWNDIDSFKLVLDYMYSGNITISKTNISQLLKLSHHFLIYKLKGYCKDYIETFLSLDNCLQIKEWCEKYNLTKTSDICFNFIHDNLMDVLNLSSFLDMSFKNIESFFTDPATGCDNIGIICLLNTLSKWVLKDLEERTMDYQKLLTIFNWSDTEKSDILKYCEKEYLFQESRLCLYFFLNTLEQNNINLDSMSETYEELKKIYENDEPVKELVSDTNEFIIESYQIDNIDLCENKDDNKDSKLFKISNKNLNKKILEQENIEIENKSIFLDEKRQGKRQIKKKFNSQEWIIDTRSRKKKFSNDFEKEDLENNSNLNYINDEEDINESVLPSTSTKQLKCESQIEISSKMKDENLTETGKEQEKKIEVVDSQNDSSCHDLDEMDYELELTEENKDLLSIKTEYSVRGKKHSATLAQWREGIKCPNCTYVGHSALRLEQHLAKVHQEDTTYTCKYCDFTCKWNREYYKHMKFHFKGPPYVCEKCNYTCDRVQFILSHKMRHTDERPFACNTCNFRSRTKGNLVVHFRIHTGEKPYKCQFCNKRFAMKNTLDQHMATHREERPYLCDQCGFTTKYQSHLLSHKRIHTGNVFYCDQESCTYFSPRKSQLAAHMRSHLSIRSHICPTCGRAFIERSHLIRHERIHLDEKPFKCMHCDYGSTRRDKLKEHIFKHHNEESNEKTYKPRKSKKNDSKQLQQVAQQVQFEEQQIPEEIKNQIIAHYQTQQIEPQNVSITIGDDVYESQLVVAPVTSENQVVDNQIQQEIQIANVSEQDLAAANLIYEYSNGEITIIEV